MRRPKNPHECAGWEDYRPQLEKHVIPPL